MIYRYKVFVDVNFYYFCNLFKHQMRCIQASIADRSGIECKPFGHQPQVMSAKRTTILLTMCCPIAHNLL